MHPMQALMRTFSWQDLRHHPWRSAAAVVAVMLGVALAFAVQLINTSALDEFAQAVRAVNGQPDLEVRAMQGTLPEALYGPLATHLQVARASPVLELTALASTPAAAARVPLRVLGVDALLLPAMAPALMPRPWDGADRFALFAPATVFLNAAALQALGVPADGSGAAPALRLQAGQQGWNVRIAGTVAAGGAPLAVMDLGAAQDLFGRGGQLSRIDLQLRPGTGRAAFAQTLRSAPQWPANALLAEPGDAAERISQLSRAYRVNLTVLALVALFTGAFLVFSVLALSVARRAPQFALLAVLGATPRQRLALVLAEAGLLGLAGSAAGIALGTVLAAAALRLLGGDLGGGYFAGVQPPLQWSGTAALLYGALGVVAALAGGWWPARRAQALPPAQTLKGLGAVGAPSGRSWTSIVLIAAGALLASAPPLFGLPLAAYVAVGLLLVGGMALLPWAVAGLLHGLRPLAVQRLLPLLALERARRMRGAAAIAVGGVVASLSLAVALTVMVASFRGSVLQWLDAVLPAPLYLHSALYAAGGEAALLPATLAQDVARLSGVAQVEPLRASPLQLDPARPALTVLARPLGADPARRLPLVEAALPVPAGRTALYISEAVVDLYGLKPGMDWPAFSQSFGAPGQADKSPPASFFIAGVWRDYARQAGAVALDLADYARLTGDARPSDLALWPQPGTDPAALRQAITALLPQATTDGGPALELVSADAVRARSLHIFDRSFAVTYWLQAVAIAIGLFGVAASFSAQVLARRKEFGLLAHLGLTRRQILAVVAGEGAAWTGVGAAAGLLLGLAVSVVLVHVVNPQSFHWTMDLNVPLARLLALCAAVVLAGTLTAWLAGRAAAGQDAVLAVKEDW
ncbi:MAG: FtsX-like permease family protein [Giesbergeria sp.]|jgi:putative ABC transport system permease protein|nr:FtsX-like permease family protein [Giesbergeria sp.]